MKLKLFSRNKATSGRARIIEESSLASRSNFSYRSSRVEENLNTGRHEEERDSGKAKKLTLIRLEIIFSILLILVVLYKVLYVSPSPEIKPIVSSEVISSSDIQKYQTLASNLLRGSIFNKSKLTLDTAAIETKIIQEYPQVQSVNIKLGFFSNRPVIYIDQTQGVIIIKNIYNQYFSVNLVGRAIKQASNIKDLNLPASTPLVNDQSGFKAAINHQVLPSSDVAFIQVVKQEIQAKNIAISSYTLPASTRELDIGIAGQTYIVKFNLANNDARQQAGTYLATIGQLKAQNIVPTKYVDVRVDGRSYYQ